MGRLTRKHAKHCDGCKRDQGARFRTMLNLFLCEGCYTTWNQTKVVPGPDFDEDEREGGDDEVTIELSPGVR